MMSASEMHAFRNKTIVVTGASSGLGARLAEALAASGANLVLFGRSQQALEAVAARCRTGGADPLVVYGDVTVPRDCAGLVERALARFQRIDILLACAGLGMWARFDELQDPAILQRIMEVNYAGVVNPAFYALPHLKQSRGMLAVISSVQGKVGVPWHTGYSASKHAVHGFCDSLRLELRGTGVDILTILPHWIQGTSLRAHALGPDGAPRGKAVHSHGPDAVPVEQATQAILRSMAKRKRVLFLPGKLRYLVWLAAVTPALADRIIGRRVNKEAS